MKKGYLWLLIGAIPAIGFGALAVLNPTNVAETSETSETLQTRHYKTDFDTFVAETKKIIPTLSTYGKNWKYIGGGGGSGGIVTKSKSQHHSETIMVEVPVLFFTDDLEITTIKEVEKNEITVNVRSASRVGKSDLGENKRHILQLLNVLDERFKSNDQ